MSNMSVSPMLMVVDTVMTASKAMVTARYITMTHYAANRCGHLSLLVANQEYSRVEMSQVNYEGFQWDFCVYPNHSALIIRAFPTDSIGGSKGGRQGCTPPP